MAIRLLERACAADMDSGASLTVGQVARAAKCLGLSDEAMLDSMSAEMDGTWRSVLLGRPSFRVRMKLDGPIPRGQLVECIAAAGFGRGEVHESSAGIIWHRNERHEQLRVSTDGSSVLDLTAQRSVALGFVPWLGWGAGVASVAAIFSVAWPTSEPSVAALVLAGVAGFSAARAAWNRILANWRIRLAQCAHRLEANLRKSRESSPLHRASSRTAIVVFVGVVASGCRAEDPSACEPYWPATPAAVADIPADPPAVRLVELWRAGGSAEGQEIAEPASVSANSQGAVAVVDFGLAQINVIDPGGEWRGPWGLRGRGPGELTMPVAAKAG